MSVQWGLWGRPSRKHPFSNQADGLSGRFRVVHDIRVPSCSSCVPLSPGDSAPQQKLVTLSLGSGRA